MLLISDFNGAMEWQKLSPQELLTGPKCFHLIAVTQSCLLSNVGCILATLCYCFSAYSCLPLIVFMLYRQYFTCKSVTFSVGFENLLTNLACWQHAFAGSYSTLFIFCCTAIFKPITSMSCASFTYVIYLFINITIHTLWVALAKMLHYLL